MILETITLGQIVGWLAFIAGALTSLGVIVKVLAGVRAKQREKTRADIRAIVESALQPLKDELAIAKREREEMRADALQNNLQTARVDLMQAIEHTPHEHKAILDLGWHYFVDLKGDAWMSGVFKEWAVKEGVDIGYIAAQAAHLKD